MKVKVNFINIGRSKFSDTKEYDSLKMLYNEAELNLLREIQ